jgi:hypothetical protein
MYTSQAEREAAMWQAPRQGRLMGVVRDRRATSSVILLDANNQSWVVFGDADLIEQFSDYTDDKILRLFGAPTTTVGRFTACGMMPLTLKGDKPTRAAMIRERANLIAYVDKMEQKMTTDKTHPCHSVMPRRARQ